MYILDELMKLAVMFIALDGSKVIGLAAYRKQRDGSAWISSARTHPDYRRKGVAAAIMKACEDHAEKDGANALRLWTEVDNPAGRALASKMGFKEVGRFAQMTAPSRPGVLGEELVKLRYADDMWSAVETSELMRATQSHSALGFGFVRISKPVLKALVGDGFVFGWDRNIATLSWRIFAGCSILEAQLLRGDFAEALSDLRTIAGENDIERVYSWLPHIEGVLDTAKRAGYASIEWGKEALLFEKPVIRE